MTRIFLLCGQSNMVGSGIVSRVPAAMRPTPSRVRLYEEGDWRKVLWREKFGPELGFTLAITPVFPDDDIVLLKMALGGANLYYDWNPDGVSRGPEDTYRGPLYPLLMETAGSLSAGLTEQGEACEWTGMLWMQGERDSVFELMAKDYGQNLTAFIARIRVDFRAPQLPFLIGQIAPRSYDFDEGDFVHAHRKAVQAAQAAVAENDRCTALTETWDLPQSDNLHFDTAGQILLGNRFAAAYLSVRRDF